MAKGNKSNFISFIRSYGPWADNETQFEEHVLKTAKRNNIEPLEYRTPYASSIGIIKDCLEAGESRMLLICGRAGDGKTHFLRKIFEDESLFNFDTKHWQQVLDSDTSLWKTNALPGYDLTIVRDLSQFKSPSPADPDLLCEILSILESKLTDQKAETQPKLLLIAGNNGKILEELTSFKNYLQDFLHDSESFKLKYVANLNQSTLTEAEQNANDQALKKLIKIFSSRSPKLNLQIAQALTTLINALKQEFIENHHVEYPAVQIIDMSNRVNNTVLDEMFHVILDHDQWQVCEHCCNKSQCPILLNRKIMSAPWVQQRLKTVLHLLKADGFHPTVRNVQNMIVNGLLGCGFNADIKSNFLSCSKISNNIKNNSGKCTIESNVYDNLFGFNLTKNSRESRPVFSALAKINLGTLTNQNIDNFLLNEDVMSSKFHQKFMQRFDLWGLNDKLQNDLNALNCATLERKKNLTSYLSQFENSLADMRRMLFFTVGAPVNELQVHTQDAGYSQEVGSTQKDSDGHVVNYDKTKDCFIDPYQLTSYPHALNYLEIEDLAHNPTRESVINNKSALALIVALNRVFNGLYNLENKKVFVSANHLSNQSIIYDDGIFEFYAYTYSSSRTINLVWLEDIDLPGLQFLDDEVREPCDAQTPSEVRVGRESTTLTLTPYMFECMMALSDGYSCLCLPQQAVHELLAFRDRIFSCLEKKLSSFTNKPNVLNFLQSMINLNVTTEGNLIANKSAIS